MKAVYRISLMLMFLVVASIVNAQVLGIRAGLNLANMKLSMLGESETFDMKPGFQIGPTAEFSLGNNFGVETGLLLSLKGTQQKEGSDKDVLSLTYIEVPVNCKAYFAAGNMRVFGSAGPYISMGISGKDKYTYEGQSETETIKFGSGEDADFKAIDFGLAVGAGVEVKSLQVGVSYGMGLANISPEDGMTIKNSLIAVTVGFHFKAK